jgi:hypothetical protein
MFILFVVPWVIDMLWPLWDPRNQTLHDKVVNSVVVRKDAGTVDGQQSGAGWPQRRY